MAAKNSRPVLAGSIVVLMLIALTSAVYLMQPPFYVSASDERPGTEDLWAGLTDPMMIYSPFSSGLTPPLNVDEVEIREESSVVRLFKLQRDFTNFGAPPPVAHEAHPDSQTIKFADGVVVRMKSTIHGFPAQSGWAETTMDAVSGEITSDRPTQTEKWKIAWIQTIAEIESKSPPLVSPMEIRDTGTHVEVGALGAARVAPMPGKPGFTEVQTIHDAAVLHPTTVTIGLRIETRGEPVEKAQTDLEVGKITEIGGVQLRLIAKFEGRHRLLRGQWWRDDETALELHLTKPDEGSQSTGSCLVFSANGVVGDLDWFAAGERGDFEVVRELVAVNFPRPLSELDSVEIHRYAGERHLVFHVPVAGSRDNRDGRIRNLCKVRIRRLTIHRPEDYYETLARLMQFPPTDSTEQEFDFSEIEFPYEIKNSTLSEEIDKLLKCGTTRLMVDGDQFDIRQYEPNWFEKTKEKVKNWWPF